ncbi:MAG: hypothetical protein PSX79_13860 [bacterium]|nr:hypothetical protein [Alphaproteobacteria bacterium]MDI1365922.1 hypothetical protein [bacterium]
MTNIKSATIATAAALFALTSMAAATPSFAAEKAAVEKVHCYGVNSCKGTSDCKTAKNDCKGMNECKGQGFVAMTSSACAKAGGSLTAPN